MSNNQIKCVLPEGRNEGLGVDDFAISKAKQDVAVNGNRTSWLFFFVLVHLQLQIPEKFSSLARSPW